MFAIWTGQRQLYDLMSDWSRYFLPFFLCFSFLEMEGRKTFQPNWEDWLVASKACLLSRYAASSTIPPSLSLSLSLSFSLTVSLHFARLYEQGRKPFFLSLYFLLLLLLLSLLSQYLSLSLGVVAVWRLRTNVGLFVLHKSWILLSSHLDRLRLDSSERRAKLTTLCRTEKAVKQQQQQANQQLSYTVCWMAFHFIWALSHLSLVLTSVQWRWRPVWLTADKLDPLWRLDDTSCQCQSYFVLSLTSVIHSHGLFDSRRLWKQQ